MSNMNIGANDQRTNLANLSTLQQSKATTQDGKTTDGKNFSIFGQEANAKFGSMLPNSLPDSVDLRSIIEKVFHKADTDLNSLLNTNEFNEAISLLNKEIEIIKNKADKIPEKSELESLENKETDLDR